jgi:hypothetical protein
VVRLLLDLQYLGVSNNGGKVAPNESREQTGDPSQTMKGDPYEKDCVILLVAIGIGDRGFGGCPR